MNKEKTLSVNELSNIIFERSAYDEIFRSALLRDPANVLLEEYGFSFPGNIKLNILENKDDSLNIILPSIPDNINESALSLLNPKKEAVKTKDFRRPTEIPPYAQERTVDGLEVEEFGTWTFGGITKAWAFNEGNITCIIKHRTVAPTSRESFVTIEPGVNARFEINGHGFTWQITNTTPFSETHNEISKVRLFVW